MKTVIVTGGIGSGKSTLCSYLQSEGVSVYDSDSRTKLLYDSDPHLLDSVETALGRSFRTCGGTLDRRALAEVVFNDSDALRRLEMTVHPKVLEDFLKWKSTREVDGEAWCGFGDVPFVVMESAIALEKPEFLAIADKVVEVIAPEAVRLERAILRDSSSCERVKERMLSQRLSSESHKKACVDAVIENSGDINDLKKAADLCFAALWS